MGRIKSIAEKMKGFKKVDLMSIWINAFWYFKRKEANAFLEPNENVSSVNLTDLAFDCKTSLSMISEKLNVSNQILIQKAKELGLNAIGDYAFNKAELINVEKICSKLPDTMTLKFAIKKLRYEQFTATVLLKKFGFRIMGESIDLSKIVVFRERNSTSK